MTTLTVGPAHIIWNTLLSVRYSMHKQYSCWISITRFERATYAYNKNKTTYKQTCQIGTLSYPIFPRTILRVQWTFRSQVCTQKYNERYEGNALEWLLAFRSQVRFSREHSCECDDLSDPKSVLQDAWDCRLLSCLRPLTAFTVDFHPSVFSFCCQLRRACSVSNRWVTLLLLGLA